MKTMTNFKVKFIELTRRCSGLRAVAVATHALLGWWRSRATTAIRPNRD